MKKFTLLYSYGNVLCDGQRRRQKEILLSQNEIYVQLYTTIDQSIVW